MHRSGSFTFPRKLEKTLVLLFTRALHLSSRSASTGLSAARKIWAQTG